MHRTLVFLFLLAFKGILSQSDSCSANGKKSKLCDSSSQNEWSPQKTNKYLLYDVNPGEGFNLRRDVYMRVATVVKILNQQDKLNHWTLVLPPWGPLYHWKTKNIGFQAQLQWSRFFDVPSLAKYVPVVELEDFLNDYGSSVDALYYLQNYAEGWTDVGWEEKYHFRDCVESPPYKHTVEGNFIGWFWGYDDISAKKFHCLSIQGYSSTLAKFLMSRNESAIMIDRAEVILHDTFGDAEYWLVRRSMVFSKKLTELGDVFRKFYLNSSDKVDKTEKKSVSNRAHRTAVGGPYVAVHLRRRDFVSARPKEVPSMKWASEQILKYLKMYKLQKVFVASDASESEFLELKSYIPDAIQFVPTLNVHRDILDGGVAIVDQWICAHGRFFIGTFESTFSFRIQEERELLGFKAETTFNRLCGDNQTSCQQPSKWTIVYK
ncbi:GDP-fucose protein O-fucosyltransferase 2-like [Uloborus diversus]|uniref:GDP-fucose protein O-fucosyltransferase 2-like n=1 Tax=Uloborus diversus TaxID=327109 RepID=UPI00240A2242|nr:GDP-fucose protein O-fucosyltransferase 2-like [Uloborus diversus]